MSITTPQILVWENPSSLFNVTVPINITWSLSTFNAVKLGNFELNMWLLRHDNPGVTILRSYPPILLAGQHGAQDRGVLFTPSADDVDIGIVQAGSHQLVWEFYSNNTNQDPTTIAGKGFSKGFGFRPQPISSSTSSSLPTPSSSSTISSSQTSQINSSPTTATGSPIPTTSATQTTQTTPPSANSATAAPKTTTTPAATTITPSTNQSVVIGLSVAFGVLLGAALIGLLFWFFHRRNKRKSLALAELGKGSSMQDLRPTGNAGFDGGGGGNYPRSGTYTTGKSYHRYEPEVVEAGSGRREAPVEVGSERRERPVELA